MEEETGLEEQDQHRRAEGGGRMDDIEAIHTTETKGCAHIINNGLWSCASLSVRSVFAESVPRLLNLGGVRSGHLLRIRQKFQSQALISLQWYRLVQWTNSRQAGRRLFPRLPAESVCTSERVISRKCLRKPCPLAIQISKTSSRLCK